MIAKNDIVMLLFTGWCSWQCRDKDNATAGYDSKEAYMRALAFMGLEDLQRRDAVREGDATAIDVDLRISMMAFHRFKHTTYLKIGHQLLAGEKKIILMLVSTLSRTGMIQPTHDLIHLGHNFFLNEYIVVVN